VQLLLLLAPFCVAALLWDKLPERMPIHWNARGEVDGYAGRTFATLFVPILNVLIALLVGGLSLIDPMIRQADPEGRANFHRVMKTFRLVFTGFFAAVALAVLYIGAGYRLDMSRIVITGLAVVFGVLGNLMGKLRPNHFTGIRTPWTLKSREVWNKTHRLTGRLFVGAAVLILASCVLLPSTVTVLLAVSVLLLVCFFSVVYSYVLYRKQQPA